MICVIGYRINYVFYLIIPVNPHGTLALSLKVMIFNKRESSILYLAWPVLHLKKLVIVKFFINLR